ncbi:hypothetical protein F4814DRAFT_451121 [Daldinia grandis]|nr:hypothetical protein F4814DRAFT_451121 [Daldinia grandis]
MAQCFEDEGVLERWLDENVSATWHSLGTCKMLPQAEIDVVDSSLSIYGIQGLKIVDLNIAPRNVVANTNGTTLAIRGRATGMFIKELALNSA